MKATAMVLLKAGADAQAADKLGRRALDIAEDSAHTKLAEFLRQWQPQQPPSAGAGADSLPPPVQPPQGSATAVKAASGLRRAL